MDNSLHIKISPIRLSIRVIIYIILKENNGSAVVSKEKKLKKLA
tara:strand:+ start:365 stop:496 length:132 start_codon:yes stop_codon:yes gene_type:complete